MKHRGSLNLEMALLIALLVLAAVGSLTFLSGGISNQYNAAAEMFVAGEVFSATTPTASPASNGLVSVSAPTSKNGDGTYDVVYWSTSTPATTYTIPDVSVFPHSFLPDTGRAGGSTAPITITLVDTELPSGSDTTNPVSVTPVAPTTTPVALVSSTTEYSATQGSNIVVDSYTGAFENNSTLGVGDPNWSSGRAQNILFFFPLDGIPSNAIITKADFKIYKYSYYLDPAGSVNSPLRMHRMLKSWKAGDSWYSAKWATPGAEGNGTDRVATPTAEMTATAAAGTMWMTFNLKSDVQQMVKGTYTNYGWQLTAPDFNWGTPVSKAQVGLAFYGPANASPNKPQLDIEYIVP